MNQNLRHILHQDSASTLASQCLTSDCHIVDGSNFVDFRNLERSNYDFKLIYQTDAGEQIITWNQKDNPLLLNDEDAKPINVLLNNRDYTNFKGLSRSNRADTLLDGWPGIG